MKCVGMVVTIPFSKTTQDVSLVMLQFEKNYSYFVTWGQVLRHSGKVTFYHHMSAEVVALFCLAWLLVQWIVIYQSYILMSHL